jgi:hypothetical protein
VLLLLVLVADFRGENGGAARGAGRDAAAIVDRRWDLYSTKIKTLDEANTTEKTNEV